MHLLFAHNTLFKEISDSIGIHYQHQQKDFIDFNVQKLLPHKLSEYGPSLAVGDVDGNRLDDMMSAGTIDYPAQLFCSSQKINLFKDSCCHLQI